MFGGRRGVCYDAAWVLLLLHTATPSNRHPHPKPTQPHHTTRRHTIQPQALGVALEEHLHLLLPALMRLVSPAVSGTPLDVRRAVLRSLKRLLPRMRLAGYGSALLHPLIKVGAWRVGELA